MKSIMLEAHYGRANIKSRVRSEMIDETVAYWGERLEAIKHLEADGRQGSKDLILQCLMEDKHHTDPEAAEMVCAALLWLTVSGPTGPTVLPYMRRGDMTIRFEITNVEGNTHNFRTTFDEATSAALSI